MRSRIGVICDLKLDYPDASRKTGCWPFWLAIKACIMNVDRSSLKPLAHYRWNDYSTLPLDIMTDSFQMEEIFGLPTQNRLSNSHFWEDVQAMEHVISCEGMIFLIRAKPLNLSPGWHSSTCADIFQKEIERNCPLIANPHPFHEFQLRFFTLCQFRFRLSSTMFCFGLDYLSPQSISLATSSAPFSLHRGRLLGRSCLAEMLFRENWLQP